MPLDLETLTPLLDASIKVVCLPAASNVSGRVYDVPTIIKCIREACPHSMIVVDAVAYAPHRRPVFDDADAVVVGIPQVFWAAPGLLRAVAAASLMEWLPVDYRLRSTTRRGRAFERGTLSHEACAGAAAPRVI